MSLHEDGDEEEESSDEEVVHFRGDRLEHENGDLKILKSFKILNYHTAQEGRESIPANFEEIIETYKSKFLTMFKHYDSNKVPLVSITYQVVKVYNTYDESEVKKNIMLGNLVKSVDYSTLAPFFTDAITYICKMKLGKRSLAQRRLIDLKAIRVREMVFKF